jgi:acetyl esterase/lipase
MNNKKVKGKKISGLFLYFIAAISFLNSDPQILSKEDIDVYENIVYSVADGQELKLDIAVPKYLKAPAPVIVDIPGGSWRVVNKSAEDALFYAKYGFIGVSVTHRTSDIAVFPAAVHDCKTVIRWLRAHAKEFNINPDKIGVTGFSSGGHLAVLLGTSGGDSFLEGKGDYLDFSSSVQAVVDHFGPTDFLRMNESERADRIDHFAGDSPESLFLGGPLRDKGELAHLANPITYIDAKDPPVLIGHGAKDGLVIINQSELLHEALKKVGVPTDFIRVKNADHMYRPYKWDAEISPTIDDMNRLTVEWFQKWLGKPELDTDRIPARKLDPGIQSLKEIHLYYKLTVELPGKTEKSFCRGHFLVQSEEEILAQGKIEMNDLSTAEKRMFQQELVITGVDLNGKEIMWNFRGEIFDSELDEKFEVMYLQGEKYEPSIEGLGYHIRINKDKNAGIEKKVYRRSDRLSLFHNIDYF